MKQQEILSGYHGGLQKATWWNIRQQGLTLHLNRLKMGNQRKSKGIMGQ